MSCECSQFAAIVRLDQHPSIERGSEELERDSWFWLVRCRSCEQLWSLDEWEKLQRQFAIKILRREGWREFDTTPLRKQYLVQSRGGVTDQRCIWQGCEQPRVIGVVYCADHLYQTGARE